MVMLISLELAIKASCHLIPKKGQQKIEIFYARGKHF